MHVMKNSLDTVAWKKVAQLKSQVEKRTIEQEIHWAQRPEHSWLLLGDKNNKLFKILLNNKFFHIVFYYKFI